MAIYEIFEGKEKEEQIDSMTQGELFENLEGFQEDERVSFKDRIVSTIFSRLFFLLLLIVDALWGAYVVAFFSLFTFVRIVTLSKHQAINQIQERFYLSLKRFLVCGLALVVALFSPALGTMFACTYFLMYDKAGIDEIVPSILRSQFKEFFSPAS